MVYSDSEEGFTTQEPWFSPYFKGIFVINLPQTRIGQNRWNRLQSIKWLSPYLNRFQGTYGKHQDFTSVINSGVLGTTWDVGTWRGEKTPRTVDLSRGEMGVALSHYRLWQHIVKHQLSSVLILEDDALEFSSDFQSKCIDTMKHLPKDWDVVLFGFWLHKGDSGYQVNPDISRVKDFCLLHCYGVSLKGARKMLHLTPIDMPLDTWMSKQSDELIIYRHNQVVSGSQRRPKSRLSRQGLLDKQNINTNVV